MADELVNADSDGACVILPLVVDSVKGKNKHSKISRMIINSFPFPEQ